MSRGSASQPEEEIRLGQVGEWWLKKYTDSPYWYRVRYDEARQRYARYSTRCEDFRSAHQSLLDFVQSKPQPSKLSPEVVPLIPLLDYYWENHAKNLESAPTLKSELDDWRTFFGKTTMVGDLTPQKQAEFVKKLASRGISLGTQTKILSTGRAALKMAEGHLLVASVPQIKMVQTQMDRDEAEPKGRPLDAEEIAAMIRSQKFFHMVVFMAIMMNTLCRPGAALGLTKQQVDFKHNLVNLNPKGRRQNKKYRPIVPLTPFLRNFLLKVEEKLLADAAKRGDHDYVVTNYVLYGQKRVKSAKTSWRHMVENSKVKDNEEGPVTPYSIRHTLSRLLRKARVPTEEIGIFLGHRPKQSNKTTSIYAPYDPDYLAEAATVVNTFAERVQLLVNEEPGEAAGRAAA